MSKQDGYSSRTAVDLERKYNFGKTFAEIFGLAIDARNIAEEAKNAYEGLNQEQIFNLLTNYGQSQGIYRGEDGNVYVNASYIKSGKLAAAYIDAENLKVSAANITGTLTATQIDTKDLKVLAANITGTLTAGQVDTTNLKVSAANITGMLTIGQLPGSVALQSDIPGNMSELFNDSGYTTTNGVVSIVNGIVTADYINALGVYASTLQTTGLRYQQVTIANGTIDFYSGGIYDNSYGELMMHASLLSLSTSSAIRFYMPNGSYWELDGAGMFYYDASGNYVNQFLLRY